MAGQQELQAMSELDFLTHLHVAIESNTALDLTDRYFSLSAMRIREKTFFLSFFFLTHLLYAVK